MAHVLQITSSTDNTVTFTSGNMYLKEYVPEVSPDGMQDVRERAKIGFTGGLDTARANVQAVNRLFEQARNYERTETGKKVYIQFDPGTSNILYRSRVRTGNVRMTPDLLGGQWGSANFELDVEWTRQGFWEANDLVQIPLSNASDTDTSNWLTVNNCFDATHDNTFRISSSDVEGDMPAPLLVQIKNASTDSVANDEIYLFHNVYSKPASFVHIIEGENSSTDAPMTSTTDATCSGGAYAAISWTSATETMIGSWTFASSDMDDAAGGRFALLARWRDISHYTDMWIRAKLETTNGDSLWVGNLSLLSQTTDTRELTWIDTFRLPPYLAGRVGIAPISLKLYGMRSTSDTHALNLDYLQLSPISGDAGWKRFVNIDQGVTFDQQLVYYDIEGWTYRVNSSSEMIADFISYGGPIMLVPGVAQKFYLLSCDYQGEAKVSQKWEVMMFYQPRRNAL